MSASEWYDSYETLCDKYIAFTDYAARFGLQKKITKIAAISGGYFRLPLSWAAKQ